MEMIDKIRGELQKFFASPDDGARVCVHRVTFDTSGDVQSIEGASSFEGAVMFLAIATRKHLSRVALSAVGEGEIAEQAGRCQSVQGAIRHGDRIAGWRGETKTPRPTFGG